MAYALNYKTESNFGEGGSTKQSVYETPSWVWAATTSTTILCAARSGLLYGTVASYSMGSGEFAACMHSDGDILYVGGSTGKLYALTRSGDTITGHVLSLGTGYINSIYCDSQGIIHCVANNGDNIKAVEYDGATLSLRATKSTGSVYCITGDGTNIVYGYTSAGAAVYANVRYASGAYGPVLGSVTISGGTITPYAVAHDGYTWYFGLGNSPTDRKIYAYSLSVDGSTFTSLGDGYTLSTAFGSTVQCRRLDTDGYFLYALLDANDTDYVAVLRFNSSNNTWTLVSSYADTMGVSFFYGNGCFRPPYYNYVNGTVVKSLKLDLTAAFITDRRTGVAPVTITFTRV